MAAVFPTFLEEQFLGYAHPHAVLKSNNSERKRSSPAALCCTHSFVHSLSASRCKSTGCMIPQRPASGGLHDVANWQNSTEGNTLTLSPYPCAGFFTKTFKSTPKQLAAPDKTFKSTPRQLAASNKTFKSTRRQLVAPHDNV
jgi:hypothetical protein